MFECFESFRKHRVNFNAFFSTTIAIIVSIALCALFIKMGLFSRSNPDVYVVGAIIAVSPVVTFLASYAPLGAIAIGRGEIRKKSLSNLQDNIIFQIGERKLTR